MTAYAASSDGWEDFRLTGQQSSLFEVAGALCGAWSLLSEDDDFFEGLAGVFEEAGTPRARARMEPAYREEFQRYLDADRLLARELVVLVQAGMTPTHVVRLVGDLRSVLGGEISPGVTKPSTMRSDVARLAEELCKAQQRLGTLSYDPETELTAGRPPHRSWLRNLGTVQRALVATAGAASVVGNVAASIASFGVVSALGLASAVGGAQAITTATRGARAASQSLADRSAR